MRETGKASSHILVLPGAPTLLAGDIHGNLHVLYDVISKQRQYNTTLIIAGDLVDRGGNNVEVIRTIVNNNSKPDFGKIHSVRGNHEDMCLKSIKALSDLTSMMSIDDNAVTLYMLSEFAKVNAEFAPVMNHPYIKAFLVEACAAGEKLCEHVKDKSFLEKVEALKLQTNISLKMPELMDKLFAIHKDFIQHLGNGGQWLYEKFIDEIHDNQPKILRYDDGTVVFAEDSDIGMIKTYMESLPYIIYVDDDPPYIVVHADMPFSDEELLRRIAEGEGLDKDEIAYATWARAIEGAEVKIVRYHRNKDSMLVIVGHQVDGGVRVYSNTVNLDVASHIREVALLLKMPECKVIYSGMMQDAGVEKIGRATQEYLTQWRAAQAAKQATEVKQAPEEKQSPRVFEQRQKVAPPYGVEPRTPANDAKIVAPPYTSSASKRK